MAVPGTLLLAVAAVWADAKLTAGLLTLSAANLLGRVAAAVTSTLVDDGSAADGSADRSDGARASDLTPSHRLANTDESSRQRHRGETRRAVRIDSRNAGHVEVDRTRENRRDAEG